MSSLPKVTVSGSVLKWARTSIRMPLDKAAERLGLSEEALSSLEASGATLRFTELEHMGTVYRRPVAAFMYAAPPAEPSLPTDHRTVRTQGQNPLTTPTILAIRFAQRVQELATEVTGLVGEAPTTRLPSAALSDDPDALARSTRTALQVPLVAQSAWRGDYEPLNAWLGAIEALGVYVLRQKMPIEETRGFALTGTPPVIVLNSEDAANGRTFSLMHELCHLMLSSPSVCDMRVSGYDRASERVEVFCNRFAGSLLVPQDSLLAAVANRRNDPSWTAAELGSLARRFNVSQEVVLRRLLIVGKTDEDFYQEWREQAAAAYARLRSARNKGRGQPPAKRAVQENGHLFTGQVLRAESGRVLSASEAAGYLGVGVKHLDTVRELSV